MQTSTILEKLYEAAVEAANPAGMVKAYANNILSTHAHYGFRRTVMLAAGKAAPAMAEALLESTGGIVDEGIVITKYGHLLGRDFTKYKNINAYEAGHPVSDDAGAIAARKALEMIGSARSEDTLVICLLSGGASALMSLPCVYVTPEEKREVVEGLLKSGAEITEINTVRKHLSAIKGGRLLQAAFPSRVISLIVSDVVGDDISAIASGPTAPDPTTATDALAVLDKYSVSPPATVLKQLLSEQRGLADSTPKEDDPIFEHVENTVIINNKTALEGAFKKARGFSLNAEILDEPVSGDVAQASLLLATKAAERLKSGNLPMCLISGGETTVKVKGNGTGGRNMEMALRFALELEDLRGITMLSAGTDGTDGPTDAAGAIVDTNTVFSAKAQGLDAEEFIANNDSYNFFSKAGGLFVSGPTGTNVMDIQLIVIGA